MLPTTVQLHDIDDVEGFVCATIERAGLGAVEPAEKEELVGEGLAILYALAEKYEPHRPGYEQAGRFSGYAAQFLPRRLGDAWHSRHPEHTRVTGPDGKREWVYREKPASLDQFLSPHQGAAVANDREAQIRPPSQLAPMPLASAPSAPGTGLPPPSHAPAAVPV